MKRLAWNVFVILATLTVVFLLWEFRTAILLFILSMALAAILRPMINYLASRRVAKGLALGITYLAVVSGMGILVLFLSNPIITELQEIAVDLPSSYMNIKNQWLHAAVLQQAFAQSLPDFNNLFPMNPGGQNNYLLDNLMGITRGSLDIISNALVVFFLSIYWSIDQDHFKHLWLSLLPSESRIRWRELWQNVEKEIGAYLRSEIIQSLLTVIFLGVGYQVIGLKYPVLLAVFGAIGWLIVWFGGLIAVIPALLAGFSISPAVGLWAAIYTISVLSILEFIVEPKLFNRDRVSSLLVIILALILGKQYGIFGLISAPPAAAALQIFANHFFRPTLTTTIPLAPPPVIQIDLLRERLKSVQANIIGQSEPPSPEIISLMDRLGELIDKTNQEEEFSD